jgi:hypothetical protein
MLFSGLVRGFWFYRRGDQIAGAYRPSPEFQIPIKNSFTQNLHSIYRKNTISPSNGFGWRALMAGFPEIDPFFYLGLYHDFAYV